jgi:hypothetical protein
MAGARRMNTRYTLGLGVPSLGIPWYGEGA